MIYSDDTISTIYAIIKKFVYAATEYPTYTARTDFIKPDGNYATVFIENLNQNHNAKGDFAGYDSNGGTISYLNYNVSATIKFFRDGAMNSMFALRSAVAQPNTYEETDFFSGNKLSLLRMEMTTNVSVPIDKGSWEERAQTLAIFNTSIGWSEDTGQITSVNIETIVEAEKSSIDDEIEVDSDGVTYNQISG